MENTNSPQEDLYQYISPPIPLIPKNKYTDDALLCHQPLM